jgi:hypothetical protein
MTEELPAVPDHLKEKIAALSPSDMELLVTSLRYMRARTLNGRNLWLLLNESWVGVVEKFRDAASVAWGDGSTVMPELNRRYGVIKLTGESIIGFIEGLQKKLPQVEVAPIVSIEKRIAELDAKSMAKGRRKRIKKPAAYPYSPFQPPSPLPPPPPRPQPPPPPPPPPPPCRTIKEGCYIRAPAKAKVTVEYKLSSLAKSKGGFIRMRSGTESRGPL